MDFNGFQQPHNHPEPNEYQVVAEKKYSNNKPQPQYCRGRERGGGGGGDRSEVMVAWFLLVDHLSSYRSKLVYHSQNNNKLTKPNVHNIGVLPPQNLMYTTLGYFLHMPRGCGSSYKN